jgi:hypothetical protein
MILSEKDMVTLVDMIRSQYPNTIDFMKFIDTRSDPRDIYEDIDGLLIGDVQQSKDDKAKEKKEKYVRLERKQNQGVSDELNRDDLRTIIKKHTGLNDKEIEEENLVQELLEAYVEDRILREGGRFSIEDTRSGYIIRRI